MNTDIEILQRYLDNSGDYIPKIDDLLRELVSLRKNDSRLCSTLDSIQNMLKTLVKFNDKAQVALDNLK